MSFFWRRDYPVFSLEAGIMLLMAAILGGILVLLLGRINTTLGALLSGLLSVLVLVLQFDLRLEFLLPLAVVMALLSWRMKDRFYLNAMPVLIVLIVAAWLDSGVMPGDRTTTAEAKSDLPPVVHIVLDAFIGLEGLPEHSATPVIRQDLVDFFYRWGFQVFPEAYSRFATTGDSMYTGFNFRHDGASQYFQELSFRRGHTMQDNAWFDRFAGLGYRFNIYQTEFLDFCGTHASQTDNCWTYQQPNVPSVAHMPGAWQRARALTGVLLDQSWMYRPLIPHLFVSGRTPIGVHNPEVFSRLSGGITEASNGTLHFAHVLLPHGPFTFEPDCSVNYSGADIHRSAGGEHEPLQPDSVYAYRNLNYFKQIQCAIGSLEQLFGAMRDSGAFDRSLIILQGDHGSLIAPRPPNTLNAGNLTSEDFKAHYSTLFALRSPAGTYSVDERNLSLATLLETLAWNIDAVLNKQVELLELPQGHDPELTSSHVFLSGSDPAQRVDVDIFED
jgi:hypothetical protein